MISGKTAIGYLRRLVRIIVILLLVAGLIALIWYVAIISFDQYLSDLNAYQAAQIGVNGAGILISSLLTVGLLYLYSQMKELQQMERRPIVEVANYELEGNSVIVWLSNYGKGSAIDLELEFEIVEPETFPIHVRPGRVSLRRESEDGARRETSVPPEKEYVKYQSTPFLRIENEKGEVRNMDWGAAVKPLSNSDIEDVQFLLRLHYSDQLGKSESVLITPESRGADIQFMSRLESEAHGIPPAELDPSDVTVEVTTGEDIGVEYESEES